MSELSRTGGVAVPFEGFPAPLAAKQLLNIKVKTFGATGAFDEQHN